MAKVESNKPFRILIADFSDHPVDLLQQQVVASTSINPDNLLKSQFSHAEILGLIPDDRYTKIRKRAVDARNIDKINKHPTD